MLLLAVTLTGLYTKSSVYVYVNWTSMRQAGFNAFYFLFFIFLNVPDAWIKLH